MVDAIITFEPTAEQLNEIKHWLIVESQKKRGFAGFYCNWKDIEDSFFKKELAVILLGENSIGFMSWWQSKKVAKLQIGEIKPGFRKNGYGRMLIEAVLDKLKKSGSMVAYMHCITANAEKTWQRVGFQRFPKTDYFYHYNNAEQGRHLYRILVPHANMVVDALATESISLWDVERHQADRFLPKWKWPVSFENGTRKLVVPVIFPAYQKWNMSWSINDEVVKGEQIKYFTKDNLEFSGFLIIEALP